jgi:hypothetical protein
MAIKMTNILGTVHHLTLFPSATFIDWIIVWWRGDGLLFDWARQNKVVSINETSSFIEDSPSIPFPALLKTTLDCYGSNHRIIRRMIFLSMNKSDSLQHNVKWKWKTALVWKQACEDTLYELPGAVPHVRINIYSAEHEIFIVESIIRNIFQFTAFRMRRSRSNKVMPPCKLNSCVVNK